MGRKCYDSILCSRDRAYFTLSCESLWKASALSLPGRLWEVQLSVVIWASECSLWICVCCVGHLSAGVQHIFTSLPHRAAVHLLLVFDYSRCQPSRLASRGTASRTCQDITQIFHNNRLLSFNVFGVPRGVSYLKQRKYLSTQTTASENSSM